MLETAPFRDNHLNDYSPPSNRDYMEDNNKVFNQYQLEANMGKSNAVKIFDEQVENIDKTTHVVDVTPDEALEQHPEIIDPLWTSINALGISGNRYSNNLFNKTNELANFSSKVAYVSEASSPTLRVPVDIAVSSGRILHNEYPDFGKQVATIQVETSAKKKDRVAKNTLDVYREVV